MELRERREDGVLVLEMSGKMDAIATPDFTAWFDSRISAGEYRFAVDCSGLSYLTSAGLRGVLTVAKQIRAKQGRLIFCGLSGVVLEVFEASGFLTILETCPTLPDARAAIQG